MKKKRILLSLLIFVLMFCIANISEVNKIFAYEYEIVTVKFEDRCLYNVFKKGGGVHESNDQEMSVKVNTHIYNTLWANSEGITNLSGLENFTDLTEIHLLGNEISDISPISN